MRFQQTLIVALVLISVVQFFCDAKKVKRDGSQQASAEKIGSAEKTASGEKSQVACPYCKEWSCWSPCQPTGNAGSDESKPISWGEQKSVSGNPPPPASPAPSTLPLPLSASPPPSGGGGASDYEGDSKKKRENPDHPNNGVDTKHLPCGSGKQMRQKECMDKCDSKTSFAKSVTEIRTCSQTCGVWTDWSAWSPCSTTCGPAKMVSTRMCYGQGCQGSYKQEQKCNNPPCNN